MTKNELLLPRRKRGLSETQMPSKGEEGFESL